MYAIISASDNRASFFPMMAESSAKTFVHINGKPILQYILDELYSYQEYIEDIIIVKNNSDDVEEYIRYNTVDPFFKTKIHIVEQNSVTENMDQDEILFRDLYSGVEHIVDSIKASPDSIILWSGDVLATDTGKITDITLSSFECAYDGERVNLFRFDEFVVVQNICVKMNSIQKVCSINDFISEYRENSEFETMNDFGILHSWKTTDDYIDTLLGFIKSSDHGDIKISIDPVRQQITKTNKYSLLPYTLENHDKSVVVQKNLFLEFSALDNATAEQKIFLPELIETGITKGGNFLDEITEEYISGAKLSDIMMNEVLTVKSGRAIAEKLMKIMHEIFHKSNLDDCEDIEYVVEKKNRERWISQFRKKLDDAVNNNDFISSGCNDICAWKAVLDMFYALASSYFNKNNIIYQFSSERMVHGNLVFENIFYESMKKSMRMINPKGDKWDIVWKYDDFGDVYFSIISGYYPIIRKKYIIDENGYVNIENKIQSNMDMLECIFDEHFTVPESKMLKLYGLLKAFEYSKSIDDYDTKLALERYMSQKRKLLIKDEILMG